ncbi:MAG: Na+/H+ antiporter subunit E [Parvibaculum sp.]|nr:Na+/H+ antiporter subunit E [Parvibaculum sp.]|tara:strand:- start:6721 stop:7194 length:474 start_codon:yes stop_codon:yes gene_type:complete
MAKAIALGIALFAFWLTLSGHYTLFLLSMGVASCGLCVYITTRMGLIDAETVPTQLRFALLTYWFWLIIEIIKSNKDMARIILSRKIELAHQFVLIPTSQQTDMGRVIFANSITLTPGTVTIETAEHALLVHAVTPAFVPSLEEMGRRVTAVEGAQA